MLGCPHLRVLGVPWVQPAPSSHRGQHGVCASGNYFFKASSRTLSVVEELTWSWNEDQRPEQGVHKPLVPGSNGHLALKGAREPYAVHSCSHRAVKLFPINE